VPRRSPPDTSPAKPERPEGASRPDTPSARRRGDAALAGLGNDLEQARRLLGDPAPEVRATALGALVRAGGVERRDVQGALADPDPLVRRRACELAPRLPGADYLPLLEDGVDAVVEAAAFALGELRDARATAALSSLARSHRDPLCRESAVAALGAIGDPRGLRAVLDALGDAAAIRRRATVALAAFDPSATEAALRRCLEDRDWQVRQIAEDLLGREQR